MSGLAEITIRNSDGTVVGRVARAADGTVTAEVLDERSRWLVELAAGRYGAPGRPRVRPSCAPPSDAPPPAV